MVSVTERVKTFFPLFQRRIVTSQQAAGSLGPKPLGARAPSLSGPLDPTQAVLVLTRSWQGRLVAPIDFLCAVLAA